MKISSAKWRPFCPGGDELTHWGQMTYISLVRAMVHHLFGTKFINIFCTDYHLTWNEKKQFLSTCTSMLKFTKLLGRGTPGLPISTCMLYFSESMLCLKLYTEIFLYMSLYLSTCVHKWAGIHTLVYEYTPQFRIFTDTWVVALFTFFFLSILFFFRIPSFLKCIKDRISSYSTSRARRWFFS